MSLSIDPRISTFTSLRIYRRARARARTQERARASVTPVSSRISPLGFQSFATETKPRLIVDPTSIKRHLERISPVSILNYRTIISFPVRWFTFRFSWKALRTGRPIYTTRSQKYPILLNLVECEVLVEAKYSFQPFSTDWINRLLFRVWKKVASYMDPERNEASLYATLFIMNLKIK